MNALLKSGICALLLLIVVEFSLAQNPIGKKVIDSISKKNLDIPVKNRLVATKDDLFSKSPFSKLTARDSSEAKSWLSAKGLSVSSGLQRIGSGYRAIYAIDGSISVFSMPLELNLSNNQYDGLLNNPLEGYLFKAGFDKDALLNAMVPELGKYKELKSKFFAGKDVSTHLREEMMGVIKRKNVLQHQKLEGIYNYINQYGNIEELIKLDEAQLKDRLTALALQQKKEIASGGKDLTRQEQQEIKKESETVVESLTTKIADIKRQLKEHGIDPAKLRDIEKQVTIDQQSIENYTSKYAKEARGYKGWQGILNRLRGVDIGSFGQQLPGSFMNKDLFLQGGSLSLKMRNGPLQIGVASSSDIGFAKDAGFTRSNFNIPKLITFLSVPVVGNGYAKSRISWTGSIEKQSYRLNEMAGISPRSGSALTLSQELGSEKMGRFTLELSKSASSFRNVGVIGSEHILLERNTFGNYFRDDLFETMAFGVRYDLNHQKSMLNTNFFFNYSGIGFQNPAQQGFGNMGLRMGGSLRKGFVKNKVLFNLRGDFKQTPVSGVTDAHWNNHNLNIETRLKLSRRVNLSLKYMDNGVQKSMENTQTGIYSSRKYQLTTSGSYKLFKKSGFSHLVLGLQDMNNPISGTGSQFLTAIYAQNIVLGPIVATGNVFYNREMGAKKLLGNMLNADAGIQYRLMDKVSAATALTYLDNTGQARQLGIRQNAQFSLWKNMEASLYTDIRKNMIAPLYPELFASNRAELSLKYYFR